MSMQKTPNTLAHWRSQFPILSRKTYLASHSLGAVPLATAASLHRYYEEWAELGILAWDGPWWQAIKDFNAQIESILGANADTVIPMENVTRGFAAIASCFDFKGSRNRVVMSDLEFTTSYPFWQGLKDQGAEIVIVKSDDGITVDVEKLMEAIDVRTLLVASSHVYFRSGAIQDLKSLAKAAHLQGAFVLGDGYQAVGTAPVNVKDLDVDFYVGGSHKWLCGGPGAGFLYVRPDLIKTLKPRLRGWFGLQNPFEYRQDTSGGALHQGIYRFLAGTPSVPALYAAKEGLSILQQILSPGIDALREVSRTLTEPIVNQAIDLGFKIRSPLEHKNRSGMVCLDFDGSKEVAAELNRRGIVLDWRPDCGIRVSPHFYNTTDEVDFFFEQTRSILNLQ